MPGKQILLSKSCRLSIQIAVKQLKAAPKELLQRRVFHINSMDPDQNNGVKIQ